MNNNTTASSACPDPSARHALMDISDNLVPFSTPRATRSIAKRSSGPSTSLRNNSIQRTGQRSSSRISKRRINSNQVRSLRRYGVPRDNIREEIQREIFETNSHTPMSVRRSLRLLEKDFDEDRDESSTARASLGERYRSATGHFHSLMSNGKIFAVDPKDAVSLSKLRVRTICKWPVRQFKRILSGVGDSESLIKGYIATGKFSIVTRIPSAYQHMMVDYFRERGSCDEDAQQLAQSKPWYHVVDGGHLHEALLQKIDENPESFGGFRWPVVVIEWQIPDVLRALARMCQEMQKEVHIIDFPFPDVLANIHGEAKSYASREGISIGPGVSPPHGFLKKVVDIYTGGQGFSANTLRAISSVAVKLSHSVVKAIRDILTEEYEELTTSLGPKKPFGSDTRIFKKLLSAQSLKNAKAFLHPVHVSDEVRIDVIRRLRYIAKTKQYFKAFPASEIDSQTTNVIAARRELSKFQEVLGNEEWPPEMDNIRSNLTRSTLMEEEVEAVDGDENILLPILVTSYVKITGSHGRQILRRYERMRAMEEGTRSPSGLETDKTVECSGVSNERQNSTQGSGEGNENPGDLPESGNGEESRKEGGMRGAESRECNEEEGENRHTSPEAALRKCGVEILEMSFEEFECNSAQVQDIFDMVLSETFQTRAREAEIFMDDRAISSFVQFIRRVLVPGGYCCLLLRRDMVDNWMTILATNQFEVWKDPIRLIKDPSKFQRSRTDRFQNLVTEAIVARKPGMNPNSFKADKSSPFEYVSACSFPRCYGIIDGIHPPANKLTFRPGRTQVNPNEWSPSVFTELMQSFCPAGGRVLDPFAGVLTNGMACISAERKCVLLEKSQVCIARALERLREFAVTKVKSTEQEGGSG